MANSSSALSRDISKLEQALAKRAAEKETKTKGLIQIVKKAVKLAAKEITRPTHKMRSELGKLKRLKSIHERAIVEALEGQKEKYALNWRRMEERHAVELVRDEIRVDDLLRQRSAKARGEAAKGLFNVRGDPATADHTRRAPAAKAKLKADHEATRGEQAARRIHDKTALGRIAKSLGAKGDIHKRVEEGSLAKPGSRFKADEQENAKAREQREGKERTRSRNRNRDRSKGKGRERVRGGPRAAK